MLAHRVSGCLNYRASGRAQLVVRCAGNGSTTHGGFTEGQKVKVVASVKVYHVPKQNSGMDLNGMEGTLVKDVSEYKGKTLSANFPLKVEFVLPTEPKPTKFQAHLGADEIAAV